MNLPIFERFWKNTKKEIFRLEKLPEYKVEGDLENFKRFLKSEDFITKEAEEWHKQLKQASNKGISITRVRIITEPLNDYLKYEIAYWKHSQKYGERHFFINLPDYQAIVSELNFNPEDFWMFDDEAVVVFHYSKNGEWIGEEVADKDDVDNFVSLKERLLKKALPMEDYSKSYKP